MLLLSVICTLPASAKEWKEYKRQHFIIYYKNAPFDFVENVEKASGQYYLEITDNMGFTRYKGWNWD